jgi:hypothetical protein
MPDEKPDMQSLEHLTYPWPQHCVRCGHLAIQHWQTPSCSANGCVCSNDPVCQHCHQLTSWHK